MIYSSSQNTDWPLLSADLFPFTCASPDAIQRKTTSLPKPNRSIQPLHTPSHNDTPKASSRHPGIFILPQVVLYGKKKKISLSKKFGVTCSSVRDKYKNPLFTGKFFHSDFSHLLEDCLMAGLLDGLMVGLLDG